MYNFTSFAMQLNELHKEMEGVIPLTDCRLRPDVRAMENGDIGKNCHISKLKCRNPRHQSKRRQLCYSDFASEEKKRLEEKQRATRKNRSKSDEEWKTRWEAKSGSWASKSSTNPCAYNYLIFIMNVLQTFHIILEVRCSLCLSVFQKQSVLYYYFGLNAATISFLSILFHALMLWHAQTKSALSLHLSCFSFASSLWCEGVLPWAQG